MSLNNYAVEELGLDMNYLKFLREAIIVVHINPHQFMLTVLKNRKKEVAFSEDAPYIICKPESFNDIYKQIEKSKDKFCDLIQEKDINKFIFVKNGEQASEYSNLKLQPPHDFLSFIFNKISSPKAAKSFDFTNSISCLYENLIDRLSSYDMIYLVHPNFYIEDNLVIPVKCTEMSSADRKFLVDIFDNESLAMNEAVDCDSNSNTIKKVAIVIINMHKFMHIVNNTNQFYITSIIHTSNILSLLNYQILGLGLPPIWQSNYLHEFKERAMYSDVNTV